MFYIVFHTWYEKKLVKLFDKKQKPRYNVFNQNISLKKC